MDTVVERKEVNVLRIRADFAAGGPPEAFEKLESSLPTLHGRRFYGTLDPRSDRPQYYACVERVESDPPPEPPFEAGTIPGGLYVRRRLDDWREKIPQIHVEFKAMIDGFHHDRDRPSVEFYRSQSELHLLLPVKDRSPRPHQE